MAPAVRRGILWACVAAVPVVFIRITSDPFNVPKLVLLIVGLSVALALRVLETLQRRPLPRIDVLALPAALMLMPLTASWALSPYRGWAVFGLQGRFQGLVPYLLVILLGMLVADAFRGRAGELAFAFAWAGAIVGGYAVLQTLGLDPFEWSLFGAPTKAISTTGNPNFTGGFLGIVLPIGLGLALIDPGRRRVVIRLLVLVVSGWVAARSQGGWAAGLAGSAIVAGYALRDRWKLSNLVGWLLAGLIAAVTVGVVLVAVARPESRFTTGAAVDRSAWSEAAFGMGTASLVWGRGPNSFAIEGVRHRPMDDALEFNFDFPDDPHSVPMSMFANLGLIGLIGFIGVLGWALWFFRKVAEPSFLQVAFMAAIVAYYVQSLVSIDELTLRVALWASLGGLAAGFFSMEKTPRVVSKGQARVRKKIRSAPLRAPWAVAGVALLMLVCLAWAGSILVADVFVRQASGLFATGDVEGGQEKYQSALSLRDSADYRGRLAFQLKDAVFGGVQGLGGRGVDPELLARADEAFSFTEEVPYLFSVLGRARLLADAAGVERTSSARAIAIYERAMELDPRNPLIRAEFARLLLRENEPERALEVMIALQDKVGRKVPEYWGVLALSAAYSGDEELARDAAAIAEALLPGQPDALEAGKVISG